MAFHQYEVWLCFPSSLQSQTLRQLDHKVHPYFQVTYSHLHNGSATSKSDKILIFFAQNAYFQCIIFRWPVVTSITAKLGPIQFWMLICQTGFPQVTCRAYSSCLPPSVHRGLIEAERGKVKTGAPAMLTHSSLQLSKKRVNEVAHWVLIQTRVREF